MITRFVSLSVGVFFTVISCKTTPKYPIPQTQSLAKNAMVVSAREEASIAGASIMHKGGNAFDAMVATEFSLAVVYPYAGNLGGGGFMVYRLADGNTGALDYREKAPLKAHEKMYLDSLGNPIRKLSLEGALAVGVPGTVAGMWKAHQKYGKLSWKEVVQPAISLAENGFVVTAKQAATLKKYAASFAKVNSDQILFQKEWKAGDTLRQPNLAQSLKQIQINGKDAFYQGKMAEELTNFLQRQGGIVTLEDLAAYDAIWRKPVTFSYKDYQVHAMSPPSSGGIVLGQILKSIEPYALDSLRHNSTAYIQLITEASRRAYADRAYHLGDPDFYQVPQNQLLDTEYLAQRMSTFDWQKATPSAEVQHGEIFWTESDETTHYSIVDPSGNAIAATTTLNGAYGSKLYHPTLGFFLNNEMDDFSSKPGVPNMFGLIGGEANKIEPGKRMLSSMTPTIVTHNGKLYMVLGSPGGSTIITTVLQTFLNQVVFDMDMPTAVAQPRFHHQWLPDEIMLEPKGFADSIVTSLQQKGYHISERDNIVIGKMDAIRVLQNGSLEAGADPRGDDSSVGF